MYGHSKSVSTLSLVAVVGVGVVHQAHRYLYKHSKTLFRSRAPICCQGMAECTLCDEGAHLLQPDRIIVGTNNTCLETAIYFLTVSAQECDAARTANGTLDLPSFCGCPASEPPNLCPFCGDAKVINEDFVFPDSDDEEIELTCSSFNDLAPYFLQFDGSSCQDIQGLRSVCCDGAAQCSLCDGDADPIEIDRIIPYVEATCGEFRDYAGVDCGELNRTLVEEGDVKGFCGCPEAVNTTPPSFCHLCPDGLVLNETAATTVVPSSNATCGDLDVFVPFLYNMTFCSEVQADAVVYGCCEMITTTTPPTAGTTSMPIQAPLNTSVPTQAPLNTSMPTQTPVNTSMPTQTTQAPATTAPTPAETAPPTIEATKVITGAPISTDSPIAGPTSQAMAATSWTLGIVFFVLLL